jgi:hypothetical protein
MLIITYCYYDIILIKINNNIVNCPYYYFVNTRLGTSD